MDIYVCIDFEHELREKVLNLLFDRFPGCRIALFADQTSNYVVDPDNPSSLMGCQKVLKEDHVKVSESMTEVELRNALNKLA